MHTPEITKEIRLRVNALRVIRIAISLEEIKSDKIVLQCNGCSGLRPMPHKRID